MKIHNSQSIRNASDSCTSLRTHNNLHYPRVLYTRVYSATVVCILRYLALTLTHLVYCACALVLDYLSTLMYHSGNSVRELTLPPIPASPSATTSFSGGYKSCTNGGRKFAKLHFRKLCVRSTLRFIECRKWR